MNDPKQDPIKAHETITMNICEVCKTKYSLEEARKRNMTCCGERLKEITERIPVPLGP